MRAAGGPMAMATTSSPNSTSALHQIVVVGGGAGGLELVTWLGDTLGRHKAADVVLIDKMRTHLWKPLLHEVAAGTMDFAVNEIDYLAQAHWHNFRYRIGEMVGLDREERQVRLAPYTDEEGREVTAPRDIPYDTLVIAIGSDTNDFGTPGVHEYAMSLDTPEDAMRFQQTPGERLYPRPFAVRAAAARTTQGRHHRCRRHRHRTRGRTSLHDASTRRLWPRPH